MHRNDGRGKLGTGRSVGGESAEEKSRPLDHSELQPRTKPRPSPSADYTSRYESAAKALPSPQKDSTTGREEVAAMLRSIGLERYVQVFADEGIDDMETAMEVNESHLAKLNIPLGHRIKILKRLREIKVPGSKPEPIPPPQPTQPAPSSRRETYDLYKTALEEFRKAGPSSASPEKPVPRPRELPKPQVKSEIKPEVKVLEEARELCSQCVRTFLSDVGVEFDGKRFCSIACSDRYRKATYISCRCGKAVQKTSAVAKDGEFFCGEACVPVPPPAVIPESRSDESSSDSDRLQQDAPAPVRPPAKPRKRIPIPMRSPNTVSDFEASVQDSTEAVRGWDAPVDASFDLERREE